MFAVVHIHVLRAEEDGGDRLVGKSSPEAQGLSLISLPAVVTRALFQLFKIPFTALPFFYLFFL